MPTESVTPITLPCFYCKGPASEWMDGPQVTARRAICAPCEYQSWRAGTSSMMEVPIG